METRNRSIIFQGLVVNLEQMEVRIGDKGWHPFQIVRHPGGAAVLPLHDDGTVTLIRQLRPAIDGISLEIPAGRLGKGEDPAECARRELQEETGLRSAVLEPLGFIYPSPGVFDEKIYLFLARGLTQGEAEQEQFEDIHPVRVSLPDALAMACDGRIVDGKTIAALMRAGGRPS
ncbi:NUDIX hydrolase [Geobacter sp. OR-1]|uniref:NUDIX hydrolase n=1 Tax=Geobacter sp. OR-1 TaxID=1266765 RepID=UPI0005A98290|nr:NUDIX hydrolase [Geobacter sp. OR-1]